MSKQVDERVVSMQFDNKNFERNASTTMSTLDKLKEKLNLSGVSKGLENVSTAAKNVNMSGLGNAVETVRTKFSALEVMGVTALANITNSAVNAGKRIVSALTIDPIKTGFQEYETQINAVQTILANTQSKGTTLNDVNEALDTLNTYADKTIYNFTEMTRNIGTFTAAGVDLDTSVNAIQGIANLAAVSGSTSQQASTAMYQLSQALSSGTVKLQDWNSVVNAGMGGQVFQDALKETARVHGVNIDKMIKKNGSFRETLKDGWLTSEILTETLQKFTLTTEGLTEAQIEQNREMLRAKGYTNAQIEEIFKLGDTATQAATKVKTFTQLWDTLKEAAQSGWTQSWEIIVGDFEEAKELLTEVSDVIGKIIGNSAEARNSMLQGWKDLGGRKALIDSVRNAFEGVMSVIKPIKEALQEIFPPITSEQLYNLTEGLKKLTEKFKIGGTTANNLKRTFKGVFALLDIGVQVIKALFSGFSKLVGRISPAGNGILEFTGNIGDFIVGIDNAIKSSNLFNKAIEKIVKAVEKVGNFLRPVAEGIRTFAKIVGDAFSEITEKAEIRFRPLTVLGELVKNIFIGLGNVIKKIAPIFVAIASKIGEAFQSIRERIGDAIDNADFNSIFDLVNGGLFAAILLGIKKFITSLTGITDNAGGFLENIKDILGGVGDALNAFTGSIKADILKKIAVSIAILAGSLLVLSLIDSEKLTTSLAAITALFIELFGAMAIFGKLSDGKNIGSLNKISKAMIGLSVSLLVLSVALKILSTISLEEMGTALLGMIVGLGSLVAAIRLLPEKDVNKAAKAIKKLSSALLILAIALKIMGSMSLEEMGVALIGMAAGLGALVGAVNLLPKDTTIKAAGMIAIALAMVVLSGALKIMATMSWDDIARSLVVLAGSLAIIAGAMFLMIGAIPGALAMPIIATGLIILAGALKIMGSMSWDELARGLVALAGSLMIISGAMLMMIVALPGASALLVVSAALAILTPILMGLGSMDLAEIGKALLALAGAFAVIGVAGLLLRPLIPTLLGLSGAITLLGVGILAAGAGVLMFAAGITALAVALAASGGAIVTFVASLIGLIPYVIEQIGVGIIKFCEVISGSVKAICEAITVVILAVVDAIVTSAPAIAEGLLKLITEILGSLVQYAPQIVNGLIDLLIALMDSLAARMPEFLESAVNFIISLINGIASHMPKLIKAGINLVSSIIQGIANSLGPIIENVIEPMLGVLKDLIIGIVKAIAPYIPIICAAVVKVTDIICNAIVKIIKAIAPFIPNITHMVEVIADSFARIVEAIAPYIPDITGMIQMIVDAIVSIVEQISPIIDSITELIRGLGDVITEILGGIGDTIKDFGDAIKTSLNGVADVFDSAFGGIADIINSVGDTIKKFLDGIANVIDSVGEAALNSGTGFEKLANGIEKITKLNLIDMAASMASVASGIGKITSHSEGLAQAGNGMQQIANGTNMSATAFNMMAAGITAVMSTLKMLITTVESKASQFISVGKMLAIRFASGIKSGSNAAKTVFSNALSGAVSNARNYYNSFYNTGSYVAQGFANGIEDNAYKAADQAKAMAKNAATAAANALKINSPSKVFRAIAYSIPEGFAQGIDKRAWMVNDSATGMAEASVNNTKSIISHIADIISNGVDSQPTIRPVLDLTDVRNGASTIGSMLNGELLSVDTSSVGAISSMMNRRQNGSNDDVISAIKDLGKTIGNGSGNTYMINGITYDDGSAVSDAIQTLVRATRIERRT